MKRGGAAFSRLGGLGKWDKLLPQPLPHDIQCGNKVECVRLYTRFSAFSFSFSFSQINRKRIIRFWLRQQRFLKVILLFFLPHFFLTNYWISVVASVMLRPAVQPPLFFVCIDNHLSEDELYMPHPLLYDKYQCRHQKTQSAMLFFVHTTTPPLP